MKIAPSRKTIHAGYADREVIKTPGWHSLVVWDVFFNGMTTGLFLVAALAELACPTLFKPVCLYAYPVALVFLLIDLVLLVLDLGDPWRFHHMLRVFKPSSPMSLGTWCLTIYSLPLTLIVAIDFGIMIAILPQNSPILEWIRRGILALGILPALGSAIYKGVLFSTSSQPGWRSARWLGGYLTNSAFVLGCAQLMILAVIGEQNAAINSLGLALELLLVTHLIPLSLLALEVYPEVSKQYHRMKQVGIGVIIFIAGVAIPFMLALNSNNSALILAATGCIFIGAWFSRYVVVMLPHHK